MSSMFSNLFSSGLGDVIDKVGSVADKLFTSDEERLKFQNELVKIQSEAKAKADDVAVQFEEQITARHQADMQSDSWLSKNIRPLTLIFILAMYSVFSISSGFNFIVTASYVELLGQWGMLIMSFYFGGRTLEKVMGIMKDKKDASK